MSGISIGTLCFAIVPCLSIVTVLIASKKNRLPSSLRTIILSLLYCGMIYSAFSFLGTTLAVSFSIFLSVIYLMIVNFYQKNFFDLLFAVFLTLLTTCLVVGFVGITGYYIFHEPTAKEKSQLKKEKLNQAFKEYMQADKKAAKDVPTSATALVGTAHGVEKYYTALSNDNYEKACQYVSKKVKEQWQDNNDSYCSDILEYAYPKGTNKQFVKPTVQASTITHPKDKPYLFINSKDLTFHNSAKFQHKLPQGLKVDVDEYESYSEGKSVKISLLNPLPLGTKIPHS